MKLSEFDFDLPKELIAQYPSKKRGEDKLLVIDRSKHSFKEKSFDDIKEYFREGDVLVLNDTKVIPARLFGTRKTGGRVELFVLEEESFPVCALVRPSGRIRDNETVTLESGDEAIIMGRAEIGREVKFSKPVREIIR